LWITRLAGLISDDISSTLWNKLETENSKVKSSSQPKGVTYAKENLSAQKKKKSQNPWF